MVMPMLWMLATSFKPPAEVALWPPVFLPQHPTFENYTGAFEAAPFGRFFLNSVLIAVVSDRLDRADLAGGRHGVREISLSRPDASCSAWCWRPRSCRSRAYMIPLYLQLVGLEWINTYQGIILPYLFMAFGIFLMRQHVASAIPTDLLEAARMDGAGEWWILRRVIAPLSGNALPRSGSSPSSRAGASSSGRCWLPTIRPCSTWNSA